MGDASRPVRPVGVMLLGLGLLAVGVVLLLDRLGILEAEPVLRAWWPLAIVAVGASQLIARRMLVGLVLALLGVVVLLSTTGTIDVEVVPLVGPLVLVAIGVALLVGTRRATVTGQRGSVVVFGSGAMRGDAAELEGQTSYCVFGDARVELSGDGRPGQHVRVATVTVFGDTKVLVPSGWAVRNRTIAVFGEVKNPEEALPGDDPPAVELTGLVLFGDLDVRRG